MGEKYPRWTYVVIFALLAIVVVLTARAVVRKTGGVVEPAAPIESAGNSAGNDSAAKDQQIEALNGEVARLRKDVETNSSRTKELESRLDETKKALAAAQQKLKSAQKQSERVAAASTPAKSAARNVEPAPAKEKTVAKNAEPPPSSSRRRPADPGTYEVIQDTAVLEKPSASAREVALLQKGMTVSVVGSQGDWLEVRSKRGNPPGFVRRDDAMFRQAQSESK
jgi:TolA-binding protein